MIIKNALESNNDKKDFLIKLTKAHKHSWCKMFPI